jgi:hypothetical protein
MTISLENNTAPDGLEALRQAAKRAALQESLRTLWHPNLTLLKGAVSSHAAPLSPLRHRDVQVLAGLFDRVDMYDIEADVDQHLLRLMPEPCWEDDPLEPVREFLF